MEPAVADGGEIVIYAPHISEVSYTHGKIIEEVGYHCRDYFMKQWDRFKNYPGGVLAHSTHVKGSGHVRCCDRHRDAENQCDACDPHPGRALPPHQPRLSGPGVGQDGRMAGPRARGHRRDSPRRRNFVPVEAARSGRLPVGGKRKNEISPRSGRRRRHGRQSRLEYGAQWISGCGVPARFLQTEIVSGRPGKREECSRRQIADGIDAGARKAAPPAHDGSRRAARGPGDR